MARLGRRFLANAGPAAFTVAGACSLTQLRHPQCREQSQSKGSPGELARVMYTSTMRGDNTTAFQRVEHIAAKAAMRNKEIGVSGQLCYDARLQRVWQVLEGNPEEVQRLWKAIESDPRHSIDEDTVTVKAVKEPTYPSGWGLSYVTFAEPEKAPVHVGKDQHAHCQESKVDLVQLKYKSTLAETNGTEKEVVEHILPKAAADNARRGITGWMLYNDRTLSVYQVLEGPQDAVEALWDKIRADPRHIVSLDTVRRKKVASRQFANWSMTLDQVECSAWNYQSY
mmetsp:Transcript_1887/g.4809  ORF Transcript_1887/g.4809 Transcript_1887/m.4809 type:complete len:283 (+) Transcript_1887:123-971(+)